MRRRLRRRMRVGLQARTDTRSTRDVFEDVEPAGWTVADGERYARLRRLRREAEKAGGAAALERLRELNRAQLRAAGRFIAACRGCAGANDANRAELGTRTRNSDSDEDSDVDAHSDSDAIVGTGTIGAAASRDLCSWCKVLPGAARRVSWRVSSTRSRACRRVGGVRLESWCARRPTRRLPWRWSGTSSPPRGSTNGYANAETASRAETGWMKGTPRGYRTPPLMVGVEEALEAACEGEGAKTRWRISSIGERRRWRIASSPRRWRQRPRRTVRRTVRRTMRRTVRHPRPRHPRPRHRSSSAPSSSARASSRVAVAFEASAAACASVCRELLASAPSFLAADGLRRALESAGRRPPRPRARFETRVGASPIGRSR